MIEMTNKAITISIRKLKLILVFLKLFSTRLGGMKGQIEKQQHSLRNNIVFLRFALSFITNWRWLAYTYSFSYNITTTHMYRLILDHHTHSKGP